MEYWMENGRNGNKIIGNGSSESDGIVNIKIGYNKIGNEGSCNEIKWSERQEMKENGIKRICGECGIKDNGKNDWGMKENLF